MKIKYLIATLILILIVPIIFAETQTIRNIKKQNINNFLTKDLNSNPKDLKLIKDSKENFKNKKLRSIFYQRKYKGIPIHGDYIRILQNKNTITSASFKKTKKPNLNIHPKINKDKAIEIAKKQLKIKQDPIKAGLTIYNNKLTYKIDFPHTKEPFGTWTAFIDSHSKKLIHKENNLIYEHKGKITGEIFQEHSKQEKIQVPFSNQKIQLLELDNNTMAYSNKDNNLDSSIITYEKFNLTDCEKATLTFDTQYEIEKGYDYLYIYFNSEKIHTLTGNQPEKQTLNIDLTPFCGKQGKIKFNYKTDRYVLEKGFFLDNVNITKDNIQIFFDDFESEFEKWENNDFLLVKLTQAKENKLTNKEGIYEITKADENHIIESYLTGPYVRVLNHDEQETHITHTNMSNLNINIKDFDTSQDQAESNVFYHVNIAHDFFTREAPFDIHEMDYQMIASIEVKENYCNAYYDGHSNIYFGNSIECGNLALSSDVIYHEYTHAVTDRIYPSGTFPYRAQTGALNEALSDYFAATINNNSCIVEGFNNRTCLRDINNSKKYPEDYTNEVHHDSLIMSGPFWKIRQKLGKEETDALIIMTEKVGGGATTKAFVDFLDHMLLVDDDNDNLEDGTPNSKVICESFIAHGINSTNCIY